MASGKMRIVVLFGGRSAELCFRSFSNQCHECAGSGQYEAVPVFVARAGQWLLSRFVNGARWKSRQAAQSFALFRRLWACHRGS